jgi:hypothetical protein
LIRSLAIVRIILGSKAEGGGTDSAALLDAGPGWPPGSRMPITLSDW